MLDIIIQENLGKPDRDLLHQILANQFLILKQIEMTKAEFLQSIADLKTEVGAVSTKVDVLEQKINNAPTDVDPDIAAAFADLKTSVDALNSKADNTPAAPPVEPAPPEEPAA